MFIDYLIYFLIDVAASTVGILIAVFLANAYENHKYRRGR